MGLEAQQRVIGPAALFLRIVSDARALLLAINGNNRNAAGVNGNTGTAANATAAQAVSTGAEIAIPLSVLGSPTPGSSILVLADINGVDDSYLSDQFLPGLPVGAGDLGGGGFTPVQTPVL